MSDEFDNENNPRRAQLSLSRSRLALAAAAFMAGYLAVCLRLVDLTLLQRHEAPQEMAIEDEGIKPLEHPLRGDIVDRNGMLMATSLKMASVYADATLVDDAPALAAELVKILPGQSKADLLKKLTSGKKFIWLQRDVTPRQEYAINALGHPALNFQEEDRRIYPPGALAAHVTGYTDVDGGGIAGVEKAFDADLKKGAAPVELSLDLRIQHILRRELKDAQDKFRAKAAAGLVMDVDTGEVIAAVSLPDFDPHHPGDAPDDAKFNRVSLGVFEMGSTFKLFSTAAALDAGTAKFSTVIDATEPIHYGRFTIHDSHPKRRPLSVPEIFIYSSNIGTARMALAAGTDTLKKFYERLGFFAPAPGELPERGQPLYPKPWRDISTLTTSFGHGVAVTPLHLARATSALANGGTLIDPTFLKSKHLSPRPEGPRVASPQTSQMVRQLLALTVAAGTGSHAKVEGYDVGGKTGTAEKNVNGRYTHDRMLSSFIGVFPVSSPRYAVLAMLDEPQPIKETHGFVTGGWTAAPVVGHVIAQMAPLYGMAPDAANDHSIIKDMGMYLKEVREGKSLAALGDH